MEGKVYICIISPLNSIADKVEQSRIIYHGYLLAPAFPPTSVSQGSIHMMLLASFYYHYYYDAAQFIIPIFFRGCS